MCGYLEPHKEFVCFLLLGLQWNFSFEIGGGEHLKMGESGSNSLPALSMAVKGEGLCHDF